MVGNPVDVGNPGCHKPTMTGDGWNPTHRNGDDLGMAYEIWVYHITPIPLKNTQRHSVHLWGFTHLWDHRTGCLRLGFIKSYGHYNMCKWYYTHGNSPRMARKVIVFTPGKSIRIWWLWASFPTFSDTTGTPNTITQRILTQLEHLNMWSKDLENWNVIILSYNSCNSLYVPIRTIILHQLFMSSTFWKLWKSSLNRAQSVPESLPFLFPPAVLALRWIQQSWSLSASKSQITWLLCAILYHLLPNGQSGDIFLSCVKHTAIGPASVHDVRTQRFKIHGCDLSSPKAGPSERYQAARSWFLCVLLIVWIRMFALVFSPFWDVSCKHLPST